MINTLAFSTDCVGTQAMFAKETKARDRFFSRLKAKIAPMAMLDDYFPEDDAKDQAFSYSSSSPINASQNYKFFLVYRNNKKI